MNGRHVIRDKIEQMEKECLNRVELKKCAGLLCSKCNLSSAYEKIVGVRLEEVEVNDKWKRKQNWLCRSIEIGY